MKKFLSLSLLVTFGMITCTNFAFAKPENDPSVSSCELVDTQKQDEEKRLQNKLAQDYLLISKDVPNVYIGYQPVTNQDYAEFTKEAGLPTPKHWKNGVVPEDKKYHPVTNVTQNNAEDYCLWLSARDKQAIYRLPTVEEWETAAGETPEKPSINCGKINSGTTYVTQYKETRAACGAVDMWGNVWELTSTIKDNKVIVKGGNWSSKLEDCNTKNSSAIAPNLGHDTVGFRVVRELKELPKSQIDSSPNKTN